MRPETDSEREARIYAIIDLAVAKGAKLLDEKRPTWRNELWASLLASPGLDMTRGCTCVIGRLYGRYLTGLKELGVDGFDIASAHGFVMPQGSEMRWSVLRDAWLKEMERPPQNTPTAGMMLHFDCYSDDQLMAVLAERTKRRDAKRQDAKDKVKAALKATDEAIDAVRAAGRKCDRVQLAQSYLVDAEKEL